MKKFTITLALSIMTVLLITTPCNAKGKAKHVVLIGLDGYTIATGILNSNLNGDNIVSIPLDIDDEIDIVYLKHEKATLSKMGEKFLDNLVKEVTFDN